MKPDRERTQESLPPKKWDLGPVSSHTVGAAHGGSGTGRDEGNFVQTVDSTGSNTRGGDAAEVSTRGQPESYLRVESISGVGMPMDWNGLLYNMAVPYGSFSDPNMHQSHISPVSAVPTALFQDPGISYPTIGSSPMPHSTLHFLTPSCIVPRVASPGLVPSPLISPQSSIPHPHNTSHFVSCPSVIQEDMESTSPWTLRMLHRFHKVRTASSVPILLPPELIPQQPQASMGDRRMLLLDHIEGPQKRRRVHRQEERLSPGQQCSSDMDLEGHPDGFYGPLTSFHRAQQGGAKDSRLSGQAVCDTRAAPLAQLPTGLDPTHFHPDHQSSQQWYRGHSVEPDGRRRSQKFSRGNSEALETLTKRPAVQPVARQPSPPQSQPRPVSSLGRETPPVFPTASHFTKGSIIQLATGELKRVEDLQMQDFLRSAELSRFLKIDSSMVVDIRQNPQRPGLVALDFSVGQQQSKVTINVPPEFPFFVFGQGWSSSSPRRTAQLYGLPCHRLQAGDVCVSVTLRQTPARTSSEAKLTSGRISELMGPPDPLPPGSKPPIWVDRGPEQCSHFLKYPIKAEEAALLSASRVPFVPQDVKLSIEGRSKAGK